MERAKENPNNIFVLTWFAFNAWYGDSRVLSRSIHHLEVRVVACGASSADFGNFSHLNAPCAWKMELLFVELVPIDRAMWQVQICSEFETIWSSSHNDDHCGSICIRSEIKHWINVFSVVSIIWKLSTNSINLSTSSTLIPSLSYFMC